MIARSPSWPDQSTPAASQVVRWVIQRTKAGVSERTRLGTGGRLTGAESEEAGPRPMEIDLHGGSETRQRRRVLLGQCGLDPVERGPEVELVGRRGCAREGAPGGEQVAADVEEVVEGERAREHRGRVGPEVAQRHLELLVSQAFQRGEGLGADRFVVGQHLRRRPGPPLLDQDLLGPLGRQLRHLGQGRRIDHGPVEGAEVRQHILHGPARATALGPPLGVAEAGPDLQERLAVGRQRLDCLSGS